jgi:hypothetical protein
MAKKVDGVRWYAEATAKIYFPDGNVCCEMCPLMETYARKQCRRTGEYLLDTRTTGHWCPLEINEEILEVKKDEAV